MPVRYNVKCSQCGAEINRVVWNYAKKRPILEFYCDNKCKGEWQRNQREKLGYTKEWLYSEYHEKKKTANQIAREIGRDPKRVWEWIRDYGMETRPRGNEYGHRFQKGDISPFTGRKHTQETKDKIRAISIQQGRVPYHPEVGSYMIGRRGELSTNWKGGITPERESFAASEEWADAVKSVWKRDRAICQRCGKDHNKNREKGAFHIHHIVSFKVRELRAEVTNLVLLCKECHRWVHSLKNEQKQFIREI